MGVTQPNLDNAEILAATGVSATTIQTWANRGILALSETQRNPGPGQKRLYSRLDAARIVVIQNLTELDLSTNAAGQIALRLERGPHGDVWRKAIEETAGHIHLFIEDTDVANIYVGNDVQQIAQRLTAMNEPMEAGFMMPGNQQSTQVRTAVVMFDVGPRVSSALRNVATRRGSFVARAKIGQADIGLSNEVVLKGDEGRFIWCGSMPEAPPAADSEERAWEELEKWASKYPGVKVERS